MNHTLKTWYKNLILLFACILFITNTSIAGIEPTRSTTLTGGVIKPTTKPILAGQNTIVFDEYAFDSNANTKFNAGFTNAYTVKECKNAVVFEINHDLIKDCPIANWSCTVNVDILAKDINGNVIKSSNHNMVVNYSANSGATYTDKQVIDFTNAHWIQVTIVSISYSGLLSILQNYVKLSPQINIERYQPLDLNTIPIFTNVTALANDGEFQLNWTPVEGAEAYDVEYMYIDDYTGGFNGFSTPTYGRSITSNLKVNWRNNATRVTTSNVFLKINAIYERGYVLYRIRAAGMAVSNFTQRCTGPWNRANTGTTVNDYTALTDRLDIIDKQMMGGVVYEHEPKFNWQYSISFAEDAKTKEVVQYMDGSYRHRQSVTRNTTDNMALVGESIYDHLGRPTINFIPVPTFNSKIDYYPNFNVNTANQPYSAADFDLSVQCDRSVNPAGLTSGAAKYYSVANTKVNEVGYQYIPNAYGYPFSVTELMPDNTGRVRRQGGIGKDHQLGNIANPGHETQYFYGKPMQEELDRLFGNSVGHAEHYEKNMVIDPNGQTSVSYLDLQGRTIATALAGNSPTSVKHVSTYQAAKPIVVNLFSSFDTLSANNCSQSDIKFLVPYDTMYTFKYDVNLPKYNAPGGQYCYSCVYNLQMELINGCGTNILDGNSQVAGIQKLERTLQLPPNWQNTACSSPPQLYSLTTDPVLGNNINVWLTRGEYNLRKSLCIDQTAATEFTKHYMANNNTIKTLDSFEKEHLSKIDYASCNMTCKSCLDSLGTKANFITRKTAELEGAPTAQDLANIEVLWQAHTSLCNDLCDKEPSACEFYRLRMLADVSPYGQYASISDTGTYSGLFNTDYDNNGLGFSYRAYPKAGTSNFLPIIYRDANGNQIKVLVNGVLKSPIELTEAEFVQYWDPQWAETLVKFHPEYCKYEKCMLLESSHNYDLDMLNTFSYDSAVIKGYLNPLGNTTLPFTINKKDPFFISGAAGYVKSTDMSLNLMNFKDIWKFKPCSQNINLWQFVYLTYLCKEDLNNCISASNCLPNALNWNSNACGSYRDLMWSMFRAVYLEKKAYYVTSQQGADCRDFTKLNGKDTIFKSYEFTNTFPDYTNTNPAQILLNAQKRIYRDCDTVCIGYANEWMEKLSGCNLTVANKLSLRNEFINICRNGCDENKPFGSSSVKPPNGLNRTPPNTYKSFADAFLAYNELSKLVPKIGVCDINLIDLEPYGHSTDPWETDTLKCPANNTYKDSCIAASFANPVLKNALQNLQPKTDTTNCKRCINCDKMKVAVDDIFNFYADTLLINNWANKNAFTNYFNNTFNLNLGYLDYVKFAKDCINDTTVADSNLFIHLHNLDVQIDYDHISFKTTILSPTNITSPILQEFIPAQPYNYLDPYGHYYASLSAVPSSIPSNMPAKKQLDTCHCNWLKNKWNQYVATPGKNPLDTFAFNSFVITPCWELAPNKRFNFYKLLKACNDAYISDIDSTEVPIVNPTSWSTHTTNNLENLAIADGLDIPSCAPCGPSPVPNPFFTPKKIIGYINVPLRKINCDSFKIWYNSIFSFYEKMQFQSMLDTFLENMDDTLLYNSSFKNSMRLIANKFKASFPSFEFDANGNALQNAIEVFNKSLNCLPRGLVDTSVKFKIYSGGGHGYNNGNGNPDSTICCLDKNETAFRLHKLLKRYTEKQGSNPFNRFFYAKWKAYPLLSQYYNTGLYSGVSKKTIKHKTINNKMGENVFKLIDSLGNTLQVKLKYASNYNNKANYGRIISIDSLIPSRNPYNCKNTKTFLLKCKQALDDGSIIDVIIYGNSKYDLLSPCRPKLPNLSLCDKSIEEYLPQVTNCEQWLQHEAKYNAKIAYENYYDSVYTNIKNAYIAKCKTAFKQENFTMDYSLKEYHYTLYYYDQANNLIQTIPPSGVIPLTGGQLALVNNHRKLPSLSSPMFPSHNLPTRYMFNTLNQLVWQKTPDAGVSEFWYDNVGRLVISQNAKQKPLYQYAYTDFDALGRIVEVGGLTGTVSNMNEQISFNPNDLAYWKSLRTKFEVVRTKYDVAYNLTYTSSFTQQNLRSRVASMVFEKTYDGIDNTYDYGIHYSYDPHGVVPTVLRENKKLAGTAYANLQYKRMDYDYDLHSGKINTFTYQKGEADQYFHKYVYDADLRLTDVYSGAHEVRLDHEAEYFYYLHGPLMRTEIGELKVQGVDYAYTMQGWIKGVNSGTLQANRDIGRDGLTGGPNETVARDVFGYSLGYYQGDFNAIGEATPTLTQANYFMPKLNNTSGYTLASPDLFNGNISKMVTAIKPFMGALNQPQGMAYQYDQLNRIIQAQAWGNVDNTNNVWSNAGLPKTEYKENFSYDGNGNILSLKRTSKTGPTGTGATAMMDNLTYNYKSGTNQLSYVADLVGSTVFSGDIDMQPLGNYQYDAIGNLIQDLKEEIQNIEWTLAGKIASVTRTPGSTKPNLEFEYDPMGNRVLKKVIYPSGSVTQMVYLRDASGNEMATYTLNNDSLVWSSSSIYGSSRVGVYDANKLISKNGIATPIPTIVTYTRGIRKYELSNHLGNVLVVISDKRTTICDASLNISYYEADIVAAQDFHAFGSTMAGRSFSNEKYRFKWNGKEAETQLFEGCLAFEARIFDNRICRWLSTDPREGEYAWQSTYAYFSNCPIWQLDINGEGGPGKTHTVKSGESLSEIAKANKTTVAAMKAANPQIKWDTDAKRTGSKKDWVYEGEKLNIPSSNAEEVEKAKAVVTKTSIVKKEENINSTSFRRYTMGDKFENAQFQKDVNAGLVDAESTYNRFMQICNIGLAFFAVDLIVTELKVIYITSKIVTKGAGGLLKVGNALDKGGLTAVGRALQKHGSRTGSIFPKATGNAAAINSQGESVLKGILTNPNATNAIRHHARFGNVLEYRIPGGQGARFSGDGKTFIGFLE